MIWNKKGKITVFGFALCLTTGAFGVLGWDLYWHWENFKGAFLIDRTQLQTTQGRVIQSSGSVNTEEPRINKKRIVYDYLIRYEYSVNNQRFQSEIINFAKYATSDINRVNQYLSKYPINANVTVYYDPSNPSFAVLEPNHIFSIASIVFPFAFICSIVTGLLWLYYR